MRPDVQRFDHAVMLSPAAVRTVVAGLRALEQLGRTRGARLTPALQAICAQLDEAAAPTDAGTDAHASTSVPAAPWLPLSAHDLLSSEEAADLLGCSPGNVRDLLRRGALPGHRTGGRWLLEREAVQLRAG
jgi:excisionase family DNA binding protein